MWATPEGAPEGAPTEPPEPTEPPPGPVALPSMDAYVNTLGAPAPAGPGVTVHRKRLLEEMCRTVQEDRAEVAWSKVVVEEVVRQGDAFENSAHALFVYPSVLPARLAPKHDPIIPAPPGKLSIRINARGLGGINKKTKSEWHVSIPLPQSVKGRKVFNKAGSPNKILETVQTYFPPDPP